MDFVTRLVPSIFLRLLRFHWLPFSLLLTGTFHHLFSSYTIIYIPKPLKKLKYCGFHCTFSLRMERNEIIYLLQILEKKRHSCSVHREHATCSGNRCAPGCLNLPIKTVINEWLTFSIIARVILHIWKWWPRSIFCSFYLRQFSCEIFFVSNEW